MELPTGVLGIISSYLRPRSVAQLAATCRELWAQRDEMLRCSVVENLDSDVGRAWRPQSGRRPTQHRVPMAVGDAVVRAAVLHGHVSVADAAGWAAGGGCLDALRWLHEQRGLTAAQIRSNDIWALQAALHNSHSGVVRFLFELGLGRRDARFCIARHLRPVCENGELRMIETLVNDVGMEAADVRANDACAIRLAAANGHLGILQCLHAGVQGLTVEDFREEDNEALRTAACNGHAPVVEWLLSDAVGLQLEDVRSENNFALRFAAAHGHAHVLRLLLDMGLTKADLQTDMNFALRVACDHGHVETVRLLVATGLDADDARSRDGDALQRAAGNGHLETVRFLLSPAVGLGRADLQANDSSVLRAACGRGNLDMLRLFVEDMGMDAVDLRGVGRANLALRLACANGHAEIVRFLLDRAGLGIEDVRAVDCSTLQRAAGPGHLAVLGLLEERFSGQLDIRVGRGEVAGAVTRPDGQPLLDSFALGHVDRARYILAEYELYPDIKREVARAALHKAASCGHERVVKFLLDKMGLLLSDIRADDNRALRLAAAGNHGALVKLLMGAGLDAADLRGCVADVVEHAADTDRLAVLRLLCECGLTRLDLAAASERSDSLRKALQSMASNDPAAARFLAGELALQLE